MVSWNDGKTSEDSVMNVTSSCDGIIKLPTTMHDPNFCGTNADVSVLCKHGQPAERFVAFEGMHTGRRFLGCAQKEGINCGVVQWIDFEWPDSMEKALAKLWDMHEESKAARTTDNLESSFTIHNLTEEKKKLQENYDKLVGDVNALLDAQEQRAVELSYQQEQKDNVAVNIAELDKEVGNLKAELTKKDEENNKLQEKYDTIKHLAGAQANVIRNLKFNHLKEKERLTKERHKLQYHISELQKSEEKIKLKLQGVKAILDD